MKVVEIMVDCAINMVDTAENNGVLGGGLATISVTIQPH